MKQSRCFWVYKESSTVTKLYAFLTLSLLPITISGTCTVSADTTVASTSQLRASAILILRTEVGNVYSLEYTDSRGVTPVLCTALTVNEKHENRYKARMRNSTARAYGATIAERKYSLPPSKYCDWWIGKGKWTLTGNVFILLKAVLLTIVENYMESPNCINNDYGILSVH